MLIFSLYIYRIIASRHSSIFKGRLEFLNRFIIISLFLSHTHTHTCVLTCESILNCLSLPPHVMVNYILYDINTVHIVSSCKMTLFDFWIFSQTNLFGYIVKLLMLKLSTCVSNAILSTLHTLTN